MRCSGLGTGGAALRFLVAASLVAIVACGSVIRPPEITERFAEYRTASHGSSGDRATADPPNLDAIRAQMAADPLIQDEFRPAAISITVIRFVPGLLRVEHEDGGLLFQTTNSNDAHDAWIIGYRIQVPGLVEPIDVLAVVADETGKVFTLRRHD